LISLLAFIGCNSTTDLISESQPIPFLSSANQDVIDLIDKSDPVAEAYQRIIWKLDKSDNVSVAQIVQHGRANRFGGLILNGYTVDEYLDIRNQLDTLVSHPMFYGTEEALLLNGQFSDAEEVVPAMMVAATGNDQYEKILEDQFLLQQSILGINFSASIYNLEYDNRENWTAPYDFKNGYLDFYKRRIRKLNDSRSVSALHAFDDEIIALIDSTTNVDSIYQQTIPFAMFGLSAIVVDSSIIRNTSTAVSEFFKNTIGFNGLLISEVHQLDDVTDAVQNGIDLIIVDQPDIKAYSAYLQNEISGIVSKFQLTAHRKVLLAKYWMNSDTPNSQTDYQPWMSVTASSDIDEGSTILVNNYKDLLPFTSTYQRDFRLLSYGPRPLDTMEYVMHQFADHKRNFYNTAFDDELTTLNLARYRFATIIVTLDSVNINPQKDSAFIQNINDMAATRKVALVNFGNPTNLVHFDTTVTMLQLFRRTKHSELLAAHILFGGAMAQGQLPITLNNQLAAGTSIRTPLTRWRYVAPEEVGVDQREMNKIMLIAREGARRKAFPGCQVFVVKGGKVIYNEGFGKHTYDRKKGQPVEPDNIYDIASVTKVAATTIATMRLFEEQKIKLNDKLSKHLDIIKGSEIRDVRIKELLTHTSGIQPAMPLQFIIEHKEVKKVKHGLYKSDSLSADYPIVTARNVYYTKAMQDSIWVHVQKLSAEKKRYKYSDVNMYLLQKVIEAKAGKTIDEYTAKYFYKPLGLKTIGYNPLKRFNANRIVPTENDKQWRGQQLDGYVHDPAAALLGGVSGNAGLFSNAHDLAVIGQMLLNGGTYGGRRYFKRQTIEKFTAATIVPNRAYGFDSNNDGEAKVGNFASKLTYGHLGFTGTAMWIDPAENLVYVFLSNRIHPIQRNHLLIKYRYRQRIHDVIYRAIEKGKKRVEGEQITVAP
jgi:CubicO group peptidase (beta-lactamase class C family)